MTKKSNFLTEKNPKGVPYSIREKKNNSLLDTFVFNAFL